MKKIELRLLGIAAILLLAAVFVGCRNDKQKAADIETGYEIIVIDSCQYIVSKSPRGDYGWVMSHKGNCKFCAARHSRLTDRKLLKCASDFCEAKSKGGHEAKRTRRILAISCWPPSGYPMKKLRSVHMRIRSGLPNETKKLKR